MTGLTGSGLVIQNNGGGDVAMSGSGTFAFAAPLLSGAAYDVTVKTQPTNPWQTCTVTGGSGTVTNANVVGQITCAPNPYSVSVNVTQPGRQRTGAAGQRRRQPGGHRQRRVDVRDAGRAAA